MNDDCFVNEDTLDEMLQYFAKKILGLKIDDAELSFAELENVKNIKLQEYKKHAHLESAAVIAFWYLSKTITFDIDLYSYMYLLIGYSDDYVEIDYRITDKKFDKCVQNSLLTFKYNTKITSIINEVIDLFDFFFDHEYLTYE